MADDAQTTVSLVMATGPLPFYGTKDSAGNYTLQSTPRVGGAQVDTSNPMPVADAAAGAGIGTPADASWGGSGSGSLVALFKAACGYLGSLVTNTGAAATTNGTTSDAAWSGSGNATVVAALKAIYGQVTRKAYQGPGGAFSDQVATVMPPLVGFGSLNVVTSSVALSSLTLGPNSAAWSMPLPAQLFLKNSEKSAGIVYVAPLGGACTNACIPLYPGSSYGFNLGNSNVSPSLIADSAATVIAQW